MLLAATPNSRMAPSTLSMGATGWKGMNISGLGSSTLIGALVLSVVLWVVVLSVLVLLVAVAINSSLTSKPKMNSELVQSWPSSSENITTGESLLATFFSNSSGHVTTDTFSSQVGLLLFLSLSSQTRPSSSLLGTLDTITAETSSQAAGEGWTSITLS